MSRKRALIAGVLALLYPGLGHLYLREWLRALAWFVVAVATAALVIPESTVEAVRVGGLGALPEATNDLPTSTLLAMASVRFFTAIDAVLIALKSTDRATEEAAGPTCPNCGRELDPDIDFCHWCTTRVDASPDNRPT